MGIVLEKSIGVLLDEKHTQHFIYFIDEAIEESIYRALHSAATRLSGSLESLVQI